jgi:putative transposase
MFPVPRSPWQNAYVERAIGSILRECLDHVVVFDERHLRRVLSSYADYNYRTRTHLPLDKDCPDPRFIQPQRSGCVIAIPQVGGLHHRGRRSYIFAEEQRCPQVCFIGA